VVLTAFSRISPFQIEGTDGTVLNSYSTGNIPNLSAPSWQQFGFFFATPVGVSDIVLKIINNSPGGCGNDLALDDITFRLRPAINCIYSKGVHQLK